MYHNTFPNEKSVYEVLGKRIRESERLTPTARQQKLQKSSPKTVSIEVVTTRFLRNADVIVEVLKRANGFCERCKCSAPFIRKKDKTPYLEVHHVELLSKGGEDTVENAIGLCPSCHRELHFG